MSIEIRNAVSLRDAMGMRRVRNTCRSFMTRDRREISPWRQVWWWFTLSWGIQPIVVEENRAIIGYGLVVLKPTPPPMRGLLTGGLLPTHRGRGLGTKLFEHLARVAEECDAIPALEVLDINRSARRVYEKLGFMTTRMCGGVIEMERVSDSWPE